MFVFKKTSNKIKPSNSFTDLYIPTVPPIIVIHNPDNSPSLGINNLQNIKSNKTAQRAPVIINNYVSETSNNIMFSCSDNTLKNIVIGLSILLLFLMIIILSIYH